VAPLHLHFNMIEQNLLAGSTARRLAMACLLGGLIGFEREFRGKPSGLRTNAFICMGAAFFTLLSPIIAGADSPNKGQIASNIVQGIGFLGAGLVLHYRNRVSGLTSAATVFVVASIGMACGAGLYLPATFATTIVLGALIFVGLWELRFNLKIYPRIYELRGADSTTLQQAALRLLDRKKRRLVLMDATSIGGVQRVTFSTTARRREHEAILQELKKEPAVAEAHAYQEEDEE
jgi:putative Mg2+ transporter-C (MgtC) family protein